MVLNTMTPTQKFEIWQPRWKDMWLEGKKMKSPIVLLAKHRIGIHNEVEFTKTKTERFKGSWYISGEKASTFPVGTNGTLECYEIPFSAFEVLHRATSEQMEDLRTIKRIFGEHDGRN